MTIITIEGRVGAGAYLLSRAVALEMGIDFVDRLVLADVARRVGVTMGALVDTERRVPTFGSRLAQGIQRMLQKSAVAGLGGDPYFGPGIDTLLARPYSEMEESPATAAEEIDEQHFIDTAASVIRDIAEVGNCVIHDRGAGVILADRTDVLRVGVVAKMEDRITRTMQRERVDEETATELIRHSDAAQHRYFEKAFESSPIDPFLYHFMWNTSNVSIDYAKQITIDAARTMEERGLRFAETETVAMFDPTSGPDRVN